MDIKKKGIIAFLGGYHLLLILLLPLYLQHFSWASVLYFGILYMIGGVCITAGYHRLFAHKAYSAEPAFESAVLTGATLSFQCSALEWAFDHRLHHNHVDTEKDPYSIKKGFWHAHCLWLLHYNRKWDDTLVRDLKANPRVMFQHRHFVALTWGVNLAVFGIGCLFMHPIAAFYMGFLFRLFAIHHSTWFINSLCHTFGAKSYARELSAVDNALLAFLTFGEGYHNYHHAFANDYRNGIRWYHFDPTKWLVWTASKLGWARNLRRVDSLRLKKILVSKDRKLFLEHLGEELDESTLEMRQKLLDLSHAFETNASALLSHYKEIRRASGHQKELLKVEIRRRRREVQATWQAWLDLTSLAARRCRLAHHH